MTSALTATDEHGRMCDMDKQEALDGLDARRAVKLAAERAAAIARFDLDAWAVAVLREKVLYQREIGAYLSNSDNPVVHRNVLFRISESWPHRVQKFRDTYPDVPLPQY